MLSNMRTVPYLLILVFVIFSNLEAFIIPENERPEFFFSDLNVSLSEFAKKSPIIRTKAFDLQIAQADEIVAKSEKGFRIGINSYGQSIHEDRPNENFVHRFRALNQVYLKKPLFHWGALNALEEIGKLNKKMSQNSITHRTRVLKGELRATFLELVVLNYRVKLAEEHVKIAQQNIASAEEKIKFGLETPLYLEEAKAEALNREISYADIQIALRRKVSHFMSLSGSADPLNLEIPDIFWDFCSNFIPQTNFPILVGAINSNEIENLEIQSSIETQRIIISNAELKPKVNITSAYFQDQIDTAENGQNLDRNNFLVGIEANWAIWDSHKSSAQKKAALAKRAKYEHLIKTKSREIRDNLNSMVIELKTLKERISLARRLVSVAQTRFEKSKLELSLNRISPLDHFSAVVALDAAKINNLESMCNYMVLLDHYEQLVSSE